MKRVDAGRCPGGGWGTGVCALAPLPETAKEHHLTLHNPQRPIGAPTPFTEHYANPKDRHDGCRLLGAKKRAALGATLRKSPMPENHAAFLEPRAGYGPLVRDPARQPVRQVLRPFRRALRPLLLQFQLREPREPLPPAPRQACGTDAPESGR